MFQRVREISDVAQNILKKRYFAPEESSWEELVNRVCSENTVLYFTEDERNAFKEMLLNTYFVPNSPCLVNSGKENAGKMACFVLDFKDTIEEIYKTKLGFAQVARKGGGCGTTLSKIRPKGSKVMGQHMVTLVAQLNLQIPFLTICQHLPKLDLERWQLCLQFLAIIQIL